MAELLKYIFEIKSNTFIDIASVKAESKTSVRIIKRSIKASFCEYKPIIQFACRDTYDLPNVQPFLSPYYCIHLLSKWFAVPKNWMQIYLAFALMYKKIGYLLQNFPHKMHQLTVSTNEAIIERN